MFKATATNSSMAPSKVTNVTSGATLIGLSRSFKDVLLTSEAVKDNQDTPAMMQAISQDSRNPDSHFAFMIGER